MKKGLLYLLASVGLGLTITLVPLVALTELGAENYFSSRSLFSEGLRQLEGTYSLEAPTPSLSDFEILAASLAVALVVYFFARRDLPARDREWIRMNP